MRKQIPYCIYKKVQKLNLTSSRVATSDLHVCVYKLNLIKFLDAYLDAEPH